MTISKTFCPAKWDELTCNLTVNLIYACCKSTPVNILSKNDINSALYQQKNNLLNGVQDPSCNYCWKLENQGYTSLRHKHLENFDYSTIENYTSDALKFKSIQVNLGNQCNFQCTYCNPKYSSQWESDVKNKSYKIFSDRFFYGIDEKNSNNIVDTLEYLKNIGPIDELSLNGGEPLQNKNFFTIIKNIKSKKLGFPTNLSCKIETIDKILELSKNYEKIYIGVSIDSTGENAEFTRYGMNFETLVSNIKYLITNANSNLHISFLSTMTSITIRDLTNTIKLMDEFYSLNQNIIWNISFCNDPKIFTLDTLPDSLKPEILETINSIKDSTYIQGLESLKGALLISKFNKSLYGQLKSFLQEFSNRKKIVIPIELE